MAGTAGYTRPMLADMRHFNEMDAVWDAWVSPGSTPGRACVEARLAAPHWKVEIAVIPIIRLTLASTVL